MGRTSESTPSAVLSEIRPKFFLGCIPFLTACRQRRKPNRKQRAFQRACPPRRRQNRRRRVSQRACLPRRRLWRVQGVSWTLRSKEDHDTALKEGWLSIFEGFRP